jgi:hypothetical protein
MRNALVLATLAMLTVAPATTQASYRYLCTSVTEVCGFRGPDAPELHADVCYGSATGVRLKGASACPTGTWAYRITHGEIIDPLTLEVDPFVALDNACDQPGRCLDGPPPSGAHEYPMCCVTVGGVETCYDGVSCGGTLYFCFDGVCNDDGTVSCFHGIEVDH